MNHILLSDNPKTAGILRPLRSLMLAAAVALMAAGIVSCGHDGAPDAPPALTVRTETVTASAVPRKISFPGTVEGRTRVTISTKLMGEISSMPFEEGAAVSRGQLLLSIRSEDLRAKKAQVGAGRAEAEAAFTNVSANFRRISELYEKKSATQKEMDDIRMAYDMTQAKLRSVGEMEKEIDDVLQYADMVSPIDGTVVGKYASVGDLASPGMPLMAVEDTKRFRVTIPVPETEIALFHRGAKVEVRVGALDPAAVFEGTVETVNPSGDPASRQYEVKLGITPPRNAGLKSGMFATVTLETKGQDTFTVPERLIVRRGQLDGLFVLSAGNEALLRWIRTGKRYDDGTVEILSGLAAGEVIVTTSDPRLEDGMKVGVAQ